jgi:hypothetical protein
MTARDEFANLLLSSQGLDIAVRMLQDDGAVLRHPQTARGAVEEAFDALLGSFTAVTRAGVHQLYVSGVTPGALYATYYSDADASPAAAVKGTTLTDSALQMIPEGITACLPDSATFSVRWLGLVRPARAASYTFTAAVAETVPPPPPSVLTGHVSSLSPRRTASSCGSTTSCSSTSGPRSGRPTASGLRRRSRRRAPFTSRSPRRSTTSRCSRAS